LPHLQLQPVYLDSLRQTDSRNLANDDSLDEPCPTLEGPAAEVTMLSGWKAPLVQLFPAVAPSPPPPPPSPVVLKSTFEVDSDDDTEAVIVDIRTTGAVKMKHVLARIGSFRIRNDPKGTAENIKVDDWIEVDAPKDKPLPALPEPEFLAQLRAPEPGPAAAETAHTLKPVLRRRATSAALVAGPRAKRSFAVPAVAATAQDPAATKVVRFQASAASLRPRPQTDPTHTAPDWVVAVAAYDQPERLSFRRDTLIRVIKRHPGGWWFGELEDGRTGWFPSNHATADGHTLSHKHALVATWRHVPASVAVRPRTSSLAAPTYF
jgi:hypothetical protein